MTVKGIDVAWARPTVAEIKGVGAHFVCRYFSTDASKNLHASEVTSYEAAGLGTVVVWETTAGRATAGHAAGVADAKAADAQRKVVGLPADMPIHFAVDTDVSWSVVQPYFDGVISVISSVRTGCYGGVKVIDGAHAHGIQYLWQTAAWSGGVWSSHATIRQTGGTALAGGADLDEAETADFGQYPRPSKPAPKAKVSLAHVIAAAKHDPAAAQGHTTYKAEVLIVEKALTAEGLLAAQYVDGSFGTKTVEAYARWQRSGAGGGYVGNAADGIPGNASLTHLAARHGFTVTP